MKHAAGVFSMAYTRDDLYLFFFFLGFSLFSLETWWPYVVTGGRVAAVFLEQRSGGRPRPHPAQHGADFFVFEYIAMHLSYRHI